MTQRLRPSQVLYEDNHLLVLNKPAGIPTMGVAARQTSMLALAKEYVRDKYGKPGNVYLGVVSRLDALVGGVLVFARTSKAAARLNEQFRARRVDKEYWAIVPGDFGHHSVVWDDWVMKDEQGQRMIVVPDGTPGAVVASLRGERVRNVRHGNLLQLQLLTGRKHQIRVQCAHHNHPILGDRKYGSRAPFPIGIALFARRLVLQHPVRHERLDFIAEPPRAWQAELE